MLKNRIDHTPIEIALQVRRKLRPEIAPYVKQGNDKINITIEITLQQWPFSCVLIVNIVPDKPYIQHIAIFKIMHIQVIAVKFSPGKEYIGVSGIKVRKRDTLHRPVKPEIKPSFKVNRQGLNMAPKIMLLVLMDNLYPVFLEDCSPNLQEKCEFQHSLPSPDSNTLKLS